MMGRSGFILDYVLHKILHWNTKRKMDKGYPLFCIIPGDVIGDDIIINGLYEEDILIPLFKKIFKKYHQKFNSGIALDVGANIGNHSVFFSRFFYKVISFEPNETTAQILRINMAINKISNILLYEVGLGKENSEKPFFENYKNLGGSFFLDTEKINSDEICNNKGYNLKILPIVNGDELLKDFFQEKICLIKLDCEGYEISAIQGLKGIITVHKPIILFESHGSEGSHGSNTIFSILRDIGYQNFYSYEPFFPNMKYGLRLILGSEPILKRINSPEDRTYRLLISSFEGLSE